MVSVLMEGARDGQRWPRPAEVVNLLRHAAPSRLRQGPPPGSFARRHPRGVITIRILVGLWLVVVTVFLCRYTLWALLMWCSWRARVLGPPGPPLFIRDEPGERRASGCEALAGG